MSRLAQALALAASLSLSAASPREAAGIAASRRGPHAAFDVHIDAAAARHGVSPELVRAVIEAESGFDQRAVSPAGAAGLMQLMPATAHRFGVADSLDARQNIFGGTRYLRVLLDTYAWDVSLSAAAYNAGEGAVARHKGIPPFRTTRAYVRRVTALLGPRPFRARFEPTPAPVEGLRPVSWAEPAPRCLLALLLRPPASRGAAARVYRVETAFTRRRGTRTAGAATTP